MKLVLFLSIFILSVHANVVLRSLSLYRNPLSQVGRLHRLLARQNTCSSDQISCSSGCCPSNTTCAIVNNVEGCCPIGTNCGGQSSEPSSSACPSGNFLCADGSACCPNGSNCVSQNGQTGCCPQGETCQGSTIGAAHARPTQTVATATTGAAATTLSSCQSGYISCSDGSGCCPAGSQVSH